MGHSQSGVRLANLVVKTSLPDRADEDLGNVSFPFSDKPGIGVSITYVVRLPRHLHPLIRNVAQNPDGDTRAGEGVPHDQLLVDAELAPKLTNLIPVAL